jgi:hypothetical protein
MTTQTTTTPATHPIHVTLGHAHTGAVLRVTAAYPTWADACAALTSLLPLASLRQGQWGSVYDPATGQSYTRDALLLD